MTADTTKTELEGPIEFTTFSLTWADPAFASGLVSKVKIWPEQILEKLQANPQLRAAVLVPVLRGMCDSDFDEYLRALPTPAPDEQERALATAHARLRAAESALATERARVVAAGDSPAETKESDFFTADYWHTRFRRCLGMLTERQEAAAQLEVERDDLKRQLEESKTQAAAREEYLLAAETSRDEARAQLEAAQASTAAWSELEDWVSGLSADATRTIPEFQRAMARAHDRATRDQKRAAPVTEEPDPDACHKCGGRASINDGDEYAEGPPVCCDCYDPDWRRTPAADQPSPAQESPQPPVQPAAVEPPDLRRMVELVECADKSLRELAEYFDQVALSENRAGNNEAVWSAFDHAAAMARASRAVPPEGPVEPALVAGERARRAVLADGCSCSAETFERHGGHSPNCDLSEPEQRPREEMPLTRADVTSIVDSRVAELARAAESAVLKGGCHHATQVALAELRRAAGG